jgi:hypothetical protein
MSLAQSFNSTADSGTDISLTRQGSQNPQDSTDESQTILRAHSGLFTGFASSLNSSNQAGSGVYYDSTAAASITYNRLCGHRVLATMASKRMEEIWNTIIALITDVLDNRKRFLSGRTSREGKSI